MRSLYFVEHQTHQATVVEVVVRLIGFAPTRFITAEGATRAVEGGFPDLLLTDLVLPGRDGLSLIRATKARAPATFCILLSSVPPGLSPSAPARYGLDAVIVRRGAWASQLAEHGGPDAGARRLLALIDRGSAAFEALSDELSSDRLTAMQRVLVLRYLAAAFDPDRVLAVLERSIRKEGIHSVALELAIGLGAAGFGVVGEMATAPDAGAETRGRAMRHLARCFPHDVVMPLLQSNLHDPAPLIRLDAAQAAFDSAVRVGEGGLVTLQEIAEARDLPDALRIAALEHVARDLPRPAVKPVLCRALASERPALVQAASTLAMRSDGVDVESLAGQAESGPLKSRLRALETLAADFPKDAVVPILERFQSASNPALRRSAFELTLGRADTGFEATVQRAAAEERGMLEACLLGALRLGPAGFAAVRRIAEEETADPEVRAMAVRMLGVRFDAARAAAALEGLAASPEFEVASAALLAAIHLGAPGFAVLRAAQSSAPIPAIRELALIHLEEYAPDPVFKPALQRALRDQDPAVCARAVELWMRRLGGEFAPLLARLARSGRPELQQAALDGALALGEGGFTAIAALAGTLEIDRAVRKRARAVLAARFPPEDTREILEALSKPTEPAMPAAATPDTGPTRPSPPANARASRERALLALEAAVRRGRAGYRAIRALAASTRIAEEVRILAIRRLAGDFAGEEVVPVLEQAIADPSDGVRSAGLGCLVLRKDARLPPLAVLARDRSAEPSLRIRALRFLASRFPKEEVRPILEPLLEEGDHEVRRAALDSLFTSLRFVPPDRVEEHLINLLTEHESEEVKIAAARALGVFGGARALRALARYSGAFAGPAVKEAAQQASLRLRGYRDAL